MKLKKWREERKSRWRTPYAERVGKWTDTQNQEETDHAITTATTEVEADQEEDVAVMEIKEDIAKAEGEDMPAQKRDAIFRAEVEAEVLEEEVEVVEENKAE